MSDLTWLMGDPVTSLADAERMLAHARRAGSGFDVGTALIFLAWGLVEGPWPVPEAIARCDALAAEAAGQRGAELNLRGCRAVLTAMGGDHELARREMAEARAGLAELDLGVISAYLALLDAVAETAGRRSGGRRACGPRRRGDHRRLRDPLVSVAHLRGPGARDPRPASPREAAEAVARIETLPAPCDTEWVIKRHIARALLAAEAGEPERGLEDARRAVVMADETSLIVCGADAHRALAELLCATAARTRRRMTRGAPWPR